METFVWSDRFLTGEAIVDSEHRELVRLVNWVGDLQAEGRVAEAATKLFDDLVSYAAVHFAHEEELMQATGVDDRHFALHRQIHQDFARQVIAMRDAGAEKADTDFILRFLTNWLAYHILGTDQAMARQVKAIREGKTPAEAYDLDAARVADPATASLLEALNSLYRLLAGRNQALLDLNRDLESRVTARTLELSNANTQLESEGVKLRDTLARLEATQRELLESERKRASLSAQRAMQQLLSQIVDGDPVATLVINADHVVTHWNKACAALTGIPPTEMLGTARHWEAFYRQQRPILADLIVNGDLDEGIKNHYQDKYRSSPLIAGAFEAEDFFPHIGNGGRWLFFTAAPLRDANGRIIGAIETLQDITERRQAEEALRRYQSQLEQLVEQRTAELREANQRLAEDNRKREQTEAELRRRYAELSELNAQLSETREQLVQSEKLASIGQLAAGVAHEINNPIGYVHSNLGTLEKYIADLFRMLDACEAAVHELPSARAAEVGAVRKELDMPFLREDIPLLMQESKEGVSRVRKIVQDLKDFSRVDSSHEWQWADVHQGLESTINIVANEIKYKADVIKEYGQLPEIQCLPSQLNQVFMNLLVNAAQAIGPERGKITLRSGVEGDHVWLSFADTGCGMSEEIRQRIFDPFYTTKPIGKGTGLGLSLSYGIIKSHHGTIAVESQPGHGSVFRIELPIRQPGQSEQGGGQ
jgi:hemerythrin-like metal-binding protein